MAQSALSAVLASKRLGAARIIALSRHAGRQHLAREFGATDIVETRGDEATEAVRALTNGIGVDAALECVGTQQSIETAAAIARPVSTFGIVGVLHGEVPSAGAVGPPRAGVHPRGAGRRPRRSHQAGPGPRLRDRPRRHTRTYAAMDQRRAIKSLIRVGSL
jgi:NADPH:quinone reductase-like Zn-dependent oxidoreductase